MHIYILPVLNIWKHLLSLGLSLLVGWRSSWWQCERKQRNSHTGRLGDLPRRLVPAYVQKQLLLSPPPPPPPPITAIGKGHLARVTHHSYFLPQLMKFSTENGQMKWKLSLFPTGNLQSPRERDFLSIWLPRFVLQLTLDFQTLFLLKCHQKHLLPGRLPTRDKSCSGLGGCGQGDNRHAHARANPRTATLWQLGQQSRLLMEDANTDQQWSKQVQDFFPVFDNGNIVLSSVFQSSI